MKSSFYLALIFFCWFFVINSCKKDVDNRATPEPPLSPPYSESTIIKTSFNENFDYGYEYLLRGRWVFQSHSTYYSNDGWSIGDACGKGFCGPQIGAAYNGEALSFLYSGRMDSSQIDRWVFTPPVAIKNGDKIVFYTKSNSENNHDQLEVRLNETDVTDSAGYLFGGVGKFTKALGNINAPYPSQWTRMEFTVSGLGAPVQSRIALRYYVPDPDMMGAIGIDAFQFIKQ